MAEIDKERAGKNERLAIFIGWEWYSPSWRSPNGKYCAELPSFFESPEAAAGLMVFLTKHGFLWEVGNESGLLSGGSHARVSCPGRSSEGWGCHDASWVAAFAEAAYEALSQWQRKHTTRTCV